MTDRAAEVLERLGGPIRRCSYCGEPFDSRGKENLRVYPLGPLFPELLEPVAKYCSEKCADDHAANS